MIPTNLLLYLGFAIFSGFLLGKLTHLLRLTAIVGYIIAGIILGPVMNIIMVEQLSDYTMNLIVDVTLGIVGFIIGIGFTKGFIRSFGKMAIGIAIIQSTVCFWILWLGIFLLTKDMNISLILGVIGLATAPAGTLAAIQLLGGRGSLSRMTVAVVGIDDGIGVIYFVFVLSIVKYLVSGEFSLVEIISIPLLEIGGAIILGLIFGGGLALIGKTIRHREDVFIMAVSFIFMCIGLCEIIGVSSILACMILGMVFINISPRIGRTTNTTIESLLPPIYVVFFAIAGLELSLRYHSLIKVGIITTIGIISVYIIYRILGKVAGAIIAGKAMKSEKNIEKYLGFALLSQAGVAIGLAILVNNELSGYSEIAHLGALIITIITLSTIIFEIIGPLGVKYALTKAGETQEVT
jgi:Kef-type K+ transport system membrane component KefB